MAQCDLAYGLILIFSKDSKKLIEDCKNHNPVDIDKWLKDAYIIEGLIPDLANDMAKRIKCIMKQENFDRKDLTYLYARNDMEAIKLFDKVIHVVNKTCVPLFDDKYANIITSYVQRHDENMKSNHIDDLNDKLNSIKKISD